METKKVEAPSVPHHIKLDLRLKTYSSMCSEVHVVMFALEAYRDKLIGLALKNTHEQCTSHASDAYAMLTTTNRVLSGLTMELINAGEDGAKLDDFHKRYNEYVEGRNRMLRIEDEEHDIFREVIMGPIPKDAEGE